ncbi:MAG: hypothetical protein HOO96_41010 [Polyangiaceae bacterium]|nr:hypothetical protein [Polyangiaceae bacterium]
MRRLCAPTASFFAVAVLACSHPQESVSAPVVASAAPSATVAASSPAKARCLPVVAAECGCVYSCGVGTETKPGVYSVRHSFWKDTPLVATVKPWCVGGQCTDAFHGEIVCSGICAPKAADATCHFEGDACVGASVAP